MLTAADHRLFEIAASHHSVFSLADAVDAGLSEPQIRSRAAHLWQRLYDGVFRVRRRGRPRGRANCAPRHSPPARTQRSPPVRGGALRAPRRSSRSRRADDAAMGSGTFEPASSSTRAGASTRPIHAKSTASRVDDPGTTLLHLAALRPSADYVEMLIHAARRQRLITYPSTLATSNVTPVAD